MPDLTITLPKNQIQLLKGNQICLEVREEKELYYTSPISGKESYKEVTKDSPEKTFTYSSRRINDNVSWGNKASPKSNLTLSERVSLYFNSFFQKTVKIRWNFPGPYDYDDKSISITVDDKTFKKMQEIPSVKALHCVDGYVVEGGDILSVQEIWAREND